MDETTLQMRQHAQIWLQNHYGTLYMELQIRNPLDNEFGEYCIGIDTLHDVDNLLEELDTIGVEKFIEIHEIDFI